MDGHLGLGSIVDLRGNWMSGLAEMTILDDRIGFVSVPCENAPTVRALEGAFGNVITAGHTFNRESIMGKRIYYSLDDIGVLSAFTPEDFAPPELVEEYERRKEAGD